MPQSKALVRRNIMANYAGSGWTALMGVAFVPIYLGLLGVESYGLIGFFGTLFSWFSILDLGLTTTLNREMARQTGSTEEELDARDILRTFETIYWIVAVIIGAVICLLSQSIAQYWLKPASLSAFDVQQTVMVMGLVAVFRWPMSLYQGGLLGLQKQVLVNGVNAFFATARGVGAVLLIYAISPTIHMFFCWQVVVSGLETFASAYFLWRAIPQSGQRPKFRTRILRKVWRFTGGMIGISLVALILTQADKTILSILLPLEIYGYYMIAWAIAGSLGALTTPLFRTFFPRFSQLAASGNEYDLTNLYHKSCQLMSVIIWPVATVLTLFSYLVLLTYTGNTTLAENSSLVLSLLVLGTAFNAMVTLPYAVQLAYGWTSLPLWTDLVSTIVLIPTLVMLVKYYGMIGGAIIHLVMNIGYMLIPMGIMHTRILKGQLWRWYTRDVAFPLSASLVTGLMLRLLFPDQLARMTSIIFLGLATLFSIAAAVLVVPDVRSIMLDQISRLGAWTKRRMLKASY